ncbi:unnamed protein product [Prunus armeniaca]
MIKIKTGEQFGTPVLARIHVVSWKETKQLSKRDLNQKKVMLGTQPMVVPRVDIPVNKQFRKDREATIARNPNPDVVVQQLDLPFRPPPGLAWPYHENPFIGQIAGMLGHGEIQATQRGGALLVQEHEALILLEGPAPIQAPQNQPEPPLIS